ncbi:MAG TPA: pyridoxamine 5'-phosphate oxidase family protein [Methylomirabilota bacterium]
MSRSLGPVLPDRLLSRLMAPASGSPLDAAVVLATVDPYGWPHPALLSYGELLALDASRIRLALHPGSRSSRHLRESGRATLVFADAELCLYVKAEALALPGGRAAPELARFELVVRDVLEDRAEGEEAGARLASGLTIAWPAEPRAIVDRHARIRAALRE